MPSWKKVIISGSDAALRSLNVSTSFTASGLNYPITDNGGESFMQTDGSGNLTFQYVKTIYEQIYNGETTTILKGDPLYVSGSQGANSIVYKADAANPAKMPVTYISADNIAPGATGRGIVLGLIKGVDTTGYPAGTEVYVAPGGGWTKTRPTGSNIVQLLGIVTKEGTGGQGIVLNPGPANLPNLTSGNVWVGNSNGLPVATPTSSLSVASASFAATSSFTTAVSGTTNYVSKFTGVNTLGNSQISDTGTQVKIGNFNLGVASTTLNLAITGSTRFSAEKSAFIEIFTNVENSPRINGYGNGVNITTSNSYGISNGNINLQPQQNSNITNTVTGTGVQTWSTGGSERMRITDTGQVTIGATTAGARLDVRAQGALSTDIAFRVRNSTDTQNFLVVNGTGDVSNSGAGGGETNTQFGINVGRNRTGNYNSLFGYQAGRDLTTGTINVLFGYNAGRNITTASGNTLIGTRAGESTIVNNTVAVGTNALVLNQTGTSNTAIGTEALYYNTASSNTAVGDGAGNANTTGQGNNFFGYASGRGNKTGSYNVFIGVNSAFYSNGSNNVFLGDSSGLYQSDGITNMTSADNSVFIGKDVKANSSGQTNQIVIGYNAIGNGSNSVTLGNDSITKTVLKGNVGIGTTTPSEKLDVNGNTNINGTLTATVKSFIIDHPTKPNKKLQYGVLEGPEHSVYVRGKLTNSRIITLPDHWHALVHEDTITVNLTPIGKKQDLWVETVSDTTITVGSDSDINCFYTVFAERKDIEKLVTEFDK